MGQRGVSTDRVFSGRRTRPAIRSAEPRVAPAFQRTDERRWRLPSPAELDVGRGFVWAAKPRAVAAQIGQIPAQPEEVELFGRNLPSSEFGVSLMSACHPEVACRRRNRTVSQSIMTGPLLVIKMLLIFGSPWVITQPV